MLFRRHMTLFWFMWWDFRWDHKWAVLHSSAIYNTQIQIQCVIRRMKELTIKFSSHSDLNTMNDCAWAARRLTHTIYTPVSIQCVYSILIHWRQSDIHCERDENQKEKLDILTMIAKLILEKEKKKRRRRREEQQ